MKKILEDKELKNSILRGRRDLSPLEKTATHIFHEEGEYTFLKWLELLDSEEYSTVKKWLNFNDEWFKKAKGRNNL